MSAENKATNTCDKLKGKVKEATGKAVGNDRLEAEGTADQVEGEVRQAAEKVKDAVKDISER
ncbi:CsbD family protein [Streptomyces sp. NPDC020096]